MAYNLMGIYLDVTFLFQTLKRISKDFSPIADFEERQVTKKDFPGRYPYRDIGTQYWEAIYTWVKEYLDVRASHTSPRRSDVPGDQFKWRLSVPGTLLFPPSNAHMCCLV